MFERIGDFLEEHPGVSVGLLGITLMGSYGLNTLLLDGSADGPSAAFTSETPTGLATADAFPEPGTTATQSIRVRRENGSIATRTVRAYTTIRADGQRQVIRETVRQPLPGVFVTSTATIVESGPTVTEKGTNVTATSVVTIPGSDTTQVVEGPGQTETVVGPTETVTVTGPGVTVPGPTVTETVETTVSVPAITVTVTVPVFP